MLRCALHDDVEKGERGSPSLILQFELANIVFQDYTVVLNSDYSHAPNFLTDAHHRRLTIEI